MNWISIDLIFSLIILLAFLWSVIVSWKLAEKTGIWKYTWGKQPMIFFFVLTICIYVIFELDPLLVSLEPQVQLVVVTSLLSGLSTSLIYGYTVYEFGERGLSIVSGTLIVIAYSIFHGLIIYYNRISVSILTHSIISLVVLHKASLHKPISVEYIGNIGDSEKFHNELFREIANKPFSKSPRVDITVKYPNEEDNDKVRNEIRKTISAFGDPVLIDKSIEYNTDEIYTKLRFVLDNASYGD